MKDSDFSFEPDKDYTIRQLAKLGYFTIRKMQNLIRDGELKAKKTGREYLVRFEDYNNAAGNILFRRRLKRKNKNMQSRKYNCYRYDRCLSCAAQWDFEFDCTFCNHYRPNLIDVANDMQGIFALVVKIFEGNKSFGIKFI